MNLEFIKKYRELETC